MSIIVYPNPILKKVCESVTNFDQDLMNILIKMEDELALEEGAALAANQVGIIQRIFVVAPQYTHEMPRWIINPEIIFKDKPKRCTEGCLSIPGIKAWTNRFDTVTMKYQDENGVEKQYVANGFYAIICQHEIDHLNGKLFVEDLSTIEAQRISKKLNKLRDKK